MARSRGRRLHTTRRTRLYRANGGHSGTPARRGREEGGGGNESSDDEERSQRDGLTRMESLILQEHWSQDDIDRFERSLSPSNEMRQKIDEKTLERIEKGHRVDKWFKETRRVHGEIDDLQNNLHHLDGDETRYARNERSRIQSHVGLLDRRLFVTMENFLHDRDNLDLLIGTRRTEFNQIVSSALRRAVSEKKRVDKGDYEKVAAIGAREDGYKVLKEHTEPRPHTTRAGKTSSNNARCRKFRGSRSKRRSGSRRRFRRSLSVALTVR